MTGLQGLVKGADISVRAFFAKADKRKKGSAMEKGRFWAGMMALGVCACACTADAGVRDDYYMAFGRYEARTPVLERAPASGFHGRVTALERVTPANAAGPEDRAIALTAWRGERVHAQVVVWTDEPLEQVRSEATPLASASATIDASAVSGRVVKYVLAVPRRKRPSDPPSPELSIGDLLDDVASVDMPTNGFRPFWYTVAVPRTATAGRYAGVFTVKAAGGRRIDFPVSLTVRDRTLPERPAFFLDLWQNPWAVARYHGVKPFSRLHYALMRPLYEELAAAGQKVITATIGDYPWNRDTYFDNYRSMVDYVKRKDGTWSTDFTVFDEYVAFAESCGIGPQIHCYTMVKFGWRKPPERKYYYIDEASGDERSILMAPDSPEFAPYWRPFLEQFEAHVKAKGWAGRVYVALDELPPAAAKASCDLIRRHAPSLKFAIASDKVPLTYPAAGVEADNFSQAMRRLGREGHLISPEFLATIPARRAAGRTTTYYICNIPEKPNTWVLSPLVESAWQGLYAAAQGFDGMLRWAAFHWPRDPMFDASYGHYEPGEAHLIYPGARASTRWELLKGSIWNFEKIRILRAAGESTPELEKALAEIDFVKMEKSSEAEYREKVGAVHRALDAASARKGS